MSATENVRQLRTLTAQMREDAQDVLRLAEQEGFESLILFGFKDGKIYIKSSKSKSTLEILGALEAAKVQIWGEDL